MLSVLGTPPRLLLSQALNFLLILSTAFMIWKTISLISNSPSPIVVVLSGSMEPAFQRGDLLVLWNRDMGSWAGTGGYLGTGTTDVEDGSGGADEKRVGMKGGARIGEVVVYNVDGKQIPIVHRILRRHVLLNDPADPDSKRRLALLTKGDNNPTDDVGLYARGQFYLDREREVIGSVVAYVPFVGYITILLSEHPWLKTVLLGLMGLMVVLQRE
ncbi:hypothetical protein BDZ91DRAFT_852853 [Kalaharituber pfeilii]|nr:hypothetical protein BDZ91DRAFT_852853 [Kalaharituber pfeilii]